MTKYHSRKTEVNGILFDSKLEAERYIQLRLLEKAGEITDLKLKPQFQIFMGYTDAETGERHGSRYYEADFMYLDKANHLVIVEDTKGVETDVFRLKWEYVQSEYPQYMFRMLKRSDV